MKRARESESDQAPAPCSPPPPADFSDWRALVTDAARRAAALAAHATDGDDAAAADEAKGERALLLARAFAHPRDSRIRFEEGAHAYFLDGARMPLSVSGLWAKYFSHFNASAALRGIERWRSNEDSPYYLLLRCLDLEGVPRAEQPEVIRLLWQESGTHASGAGTALHRAIELRLNGAEIQPPTATAPAWRTAKSSRCEGGFFAPTPPP